jgi:predicted nucleic acid-binding Zn ribbon protein
VLPVQQIASGVLGDVIRRQRPSPARTAFAWSVAVGPALARATTVELRDRVLIVTPKDARWTRELERAADTILGRVQLLVGPEVQQIHVVPDAGASNSEPRSSNLPPR